VHLSIRRIESAEEILECAALMVATNPWNKLCFSLEQCQAHLVHPAIEVYGAIGVGSEIEGFVASMALGIGFEPLLEYICVREQSRGQGVGTFLIEYFETILFPLADNLYLFVSDINPEAARLYRRLGYYQVGALPDYNLPMQTEFLFRKTRGPRQKKGSPYDSSIK
jgi:ribosomal protein S18 acetylase RimI-like enzyme